MPKDEHRDWYPASTLPEQNLEENSQADLSARAHWARLYIWLLAAVWGGIVTGLVEGVGLWAFQRINWARWGPMIHVSAPIVWISPLVDGCFFVIVALLAWSITRLVQKNPSFRVLAFLLAYFAAYDWLTLTGRIYHMACILFAVGAAVAFSRWLGTHPPNAVKFLRKSLPAALALYLIALGGIEGHRWWSERAALAALPPTAPKSPNVLVIVIDTLRADHVSAYGYSRPTTPNLDRLAKEGVLFENAISPSSWSLPSHVSLVTGRYLHDHKVGNVQPEPWFGWGKTGLGGLPTIGEVLEKRGYRTAAFSANRTYFSKDLGFGRGFIHFEDYFNSVGDAFVRTLYGREFARIYLKRSNKSLIKRTLRKLGWTSLLDQDAEGSGSYGGAFGIRKHATEVNSELLRWADRDRDRPFFAFLNYFDVHDPYGGPSSYPKPGWAQNSDIDRYDDGVKYVDDCLGQLMDALRQKGIADRTFVIVTSDHGESLGQHYLMTHGRALYWELIHVPLVLWYPAHVPTGRTVTEPVSNIEIPATILEMLGVNEASFVGPGLITHIGNRGPNESEDPVSELAQNKYPGKHDEKADALIPTATTGAMQSLVTPQWQLISHSRLGQQLYDWTKDESELNDVASTPKGKEALMKLLPQLQNLSRK